MWEYSQKLLDHFKNPRNLGKMENPDGVGREGNPTCGDVMELFIKVKDNRIVDIKFLTFGCVAAIGISSILTEVVKGKTLEEARKITASDLVKEAGDVPPVKYHCSVLGIQALNGAIEDYKKRNKQK
ncbi:MAG: iron-sulfur cluster assembly scaffold protein [Candidatus Berkelbacteria bacterium]|nr:iron-sulfur cluster assembly scaffold protein [Candidatus Berkelbacteria bacterium]